MPSVHQILPSFNSKDAICNEAMLIRDYYRGKGFQSEIYVDILLPEHAKQYGLKTFARAKLSSSSVYLYHFSVSDRIARKVGSFSGKWILRYHNITPSHFFLRWDRKMTIMLHEGREILKSLSGKFVLNLADSLYNKSDLVAAGFRDASVIPLIYPLSSSMEDPDPEWMKRLNDGKTNIIFVGRIAPNKKQDDLIRTFYYYHKFLNPNARLILPGGHSDENRPYSSYLFNLVQTLNLTDAVFLPGKIEDTQLIALYKSAHLFLSMSEHEGFCVPIVEAMKYGIPILAHASTAVPDTLGDGGILFKHKNFPVIANMMDELVRNRKLRELIADNQSKMMGLYDNERNLKRLDSVLSQFF